MITLAFPVSTKRFWSLPLGISFLLLIFLSTPTATAQTQQPPFFASTAVNGQETVVTFLRQAVFWLLPRCPSRTNVCQKQSIGNGRQFLFGVCANGVARYSFDPTSGAVAEIAPGSPYTTSTTGNSVYAVTEATGSVPLPD
jgi:hypothetical protein